MSRGKTWDRSTYDITELLHIFSNPLMCKAKCVFPDPTSWIRVIKRKSLSVAALPVTLEFKSSIHDSTAVFASLCLLPPKTWGSIRVGVGLLGYGFCAKP